MSWYKKAQSEINPLDGRNNNSARNAVRKLYFKLSQGFYDDDYWNGVTPVWDAFNEAGLDWSMTGTQYRKDERGNPSSKEWTFEIYFTNNNGKPTTLGGNLTASGAGSTDEPLSRYDVTVNVF